MIKQTLALTAALLIAGGTARSAHSTEWTATQLAEICEDTNALAIGICSGYITGILEVAQAEMRSGDYHSIKFCIDAHSPTPEAAYAISNKVVQLVHSYPYTSERTGSLTAVLQATAYLFPCTK